MARVTHTAQVLNGNFSTSGKNLTFTAADASNFEQTLPLGQILIVAHNTGVGANTVTITSTPYFGRTGNITAHSIAADGVTIFGPLQSKGWVQTDGYIYFAASDAEVLFAVVKLG